MKYSKYDIVFQEVPDEITLVFEISNCRHNCGDCHSPHLREDIGTLLTMDEFKRVVNQYPDMITNVAFFGGEQYKEIFECFDYATSIGLKTTLWTGSEDVAEILKEKVTFLKTGPYNKELGDLTSVTTNQKYIEVATGRHIQLGELHAQGGSF